MHNDDFWNLFLITGNIEFYLEFRNNETQSVYFMEEDDHTKLIDLENNFLR